MLEARRQLLQGKAAPAEAAEPDHEHALRLAAAALMFEIVRADASVEESERTVMRAALQSSFGLSTEETGELVRLAETESKGAASLYEFTSLVDAGLDASQKKRIVELLWLVTFADGRKDAHEEHLVRRIAGLLHVPHPDFIDAKQRARERSSEDQRSG
jgi:uncharacterized tellurite resistance protein B-like protein